MHQVFRRSALVCAATLFTCAIVQAQSIAISPTGYITAGLGKTVQFSAQLTSLTGGVTWSVGRPGLNTGLGAISSTGLYTAPTVMPSNGQVQITATSMMNSSISAVTYLYLLTPGPTVTSVSPNPLPTGSYTITITGSGFIKGCVAFQNGIALSAKFVSSTTLTAGVYQPAATSSSFWVVNSGSSPSNTVVVPVSGSSSGGSGSGGSGGSGGGSGGSGGGSTPAPVVSPAKVTLALLGTQQFTATNATSWSATSGSVTSAGLYTAPSTMPASGSDTVTATGPGGQGTATVTLVSNTAPAITSVSLNPIPLGVFSTTINGTGFTALSTATLNGSALTIGGWTSTTLNVSGYSGAGGLENLVVSNGPISSLPFAVQVGVANPQVSAAAARRFLEQGAFGPTPADAAHLQSIGFQGWLTEQFNMAPVSNYTPLLNTSQGGMPTYFLANAVTNPDQLRQRVAFALSQMFVTSITTIIWNGDMVPYQNMLLSDAFTNYRQILGDVTLSPAMGEYLNMANNAKANPAAGTVANENYAREVMQLFSLGTTLLNPDGTQKLDASNNPIPTYLQTDVTELARVFTGWTYAPKPGGSTYWGAYINSSGPMVPFPSMHDYGSKNLVNGYTAAANLTPQADLAGALDNLANHPNTAPFFSKFLIKHLVKSNPSPAYVGRVAAVFTATGGDMKSIITAILLDQEARANDQGGNDQATDGHLQEPALMLPGFIRAFGGQMTTANYYASEMAAMGEDIYNPPSVFNYYSPGYVIPGFGVAGPEFQIDNPNNAILRENLVASFFNQYSNPVQSYGPGTTVDLTAWLPLAATPATLVDALDLTLTHGTMPAGMKSTIVSAVTADQGGNLRRVQTGIYLILQSSYYNVWH